MSTRIPTPGSRQCFIAGRPPLSPASAQPGPARPSCPPSPSADPRRAAGGHRCPSRRPFSSRFTAPPQPPPGPLPLPPSAPPPYRPAAAAALLAPICLIARGQQHRCSPGRAPPAAARLRRGGGRTLRPGPGRSRAEGSGARPGPAPPRPALRGALFPRMQPPPGRRPCPPAPRSAREAARRGRPGGRPAPRGARRHCRGRSGRRRLPRRGGGL
ncbi:unnamed protein product, partial [Coccothraustes coccothraustes]